MIDLLNHPAVQAGLAPFVLALALTLLLARMHLSGLALIAGFALMVYLTNIFAFVPLTSSRKIVLLGLSAAGLGLFLMRYNPRWLSAALSLAGGAAVVWVVWRILQQQELTTMLLWGAACAIYVAWLVYWFDTLHALPVPAVTAGMSLGLGSGAAALFGSSALLGQFGLALGAAAGAFWLVQLVRGQAIPCGRIFTLPVSLIAGLTACVGVLSAQLPWYALLPLAGIPLAAKTPLPTGAVWLQSLLLSIATLLCAALALYLTWQVAGAPPL